MSTNHMHVGTVYFRKQGGGIRRLLATQLEIGRKK